MRISRGREGDFSTLHTLPLGNVVGELHDVTHSELYAPAPWGVRLNQRRNMAQHYRSAQPYRPRNRLKLQLELSTIGGTDIHWEVIGGQVDGKVTMPNGLRPSNLEIAEARRPQRRLPVSGW